jgi:C-terminal processing protease CtpA/Prc
MKALDLRGGDIITAINDKKYDLDNISEMKSDQWKEGEPISITINRDGKDQTLLGRVKLSYKDVERFQATDNTKAKLKKAWLKN